jgi:hypothetical protein
VPHAVWIYILWLGKEAQIRLVEISSLGFGVVSEKQVLQGTKKRGCLVKDSLFSFLEEGY